MTGEKQQRQEGKKLNRIISLSLFAYVILFSAFGATSYTSNAITNLPISYSEFFGKVLLNNYIGIIFYLQNILIVFLAFPFKFYIAKEFLFILFYEYFNKSLSNKID